MQDPRVKIAHTLPFSPKIYVYLNLSLNYLASEGIFLKVARFLKTIYFFVEI